MAARADECIFGLAGYVGNQRDHCRCCPLPTSRVGDMIPTHPVQWLLGFPPPPRAGERAICVPRVSGLGARHGPFPCTLPPAPSQDLDRNPQERSQAQLGLGTTLGVGVGMGVGLYIHPAPPLFGSLQSSHLCQQGPCDMSVTRGGSWGFQSSPSLTPVTCPFPSAVPLSPQWEQGLNIPPPLTSASPLIPLSSSLRVAAPPAKAPPRGNNGARDTQCKWFLCAPWGGGQRGQLSAPRPARPSLTSAPSLCAAPKKGEGKREGRRAGKAREYRGGGGGGQTDGDEDTEKGGQRKGQTCRLPGAGPWPREACSKWDHVKPPFLQDTSSQIQWQLHSVHLIHVG